MRLGTDTQPNAILAASVILLLTRNKKLNIPLIILWILWAISLLLIFKNETSLFIYIKNVINYLSPPLLALTIYNFSEEGYRIKFKYFLTAVLVYLGVGLVQMYLSPDFLTSIVNGSRGIMVGGRGVTSLAPEPAFYGSMMLFLIIYSLLVYDKKKNYIAIPLLVFQLLFVAKSSTGAAILLIAFCSFMIIKILQLNMKYILVSGLIILATLSTIRSVVTSLEGTRMGDVLYTFVENPLLITKIDESVGIRFTGTIAPFLSMKHERFMPMGIGNYQEFLNGLYVKGMYRSFLTPYIIQDKDRLGGSINMVLFQLGFLGLLLPLALYLAFRKLLRRDHLLFGFVLFIAILFTQIQMTHAMIGFIIGIAMRMNYKQVST